MSDPSAEVVAQLLREAMGALGQIGLKILNGFHHIHLRQGTSPLYAVTHAATTSPMKARW
jgi:hypothetical protein